MNPDPPTPTVVLTPEAQAIVKSTYPIIEEHGLAITTRMYEKLFKYYPGMQVFFKDAGPELQQKLANAVLAYCANVDKPEVLVPVLQGIAAKHVDSGVLPEHYTVVGDMLLAAMVDVLGPLDASVVNAWGDAYGYLASVMVQLESAIYAEAA